MNSRKARQQAHSAAFGAREALEAAFRHEMAPQVTAQVVIKRRRVAGPEEAPAAASPPAQEPAPQAAPRVHRLQRPTTEPWPDDTAPDRESATPVADGTGSGPTVKPRRARRHLHGEVTTVYRAPAVTAPAADVPAPVAGNAQQDAGRDSASHSPLPMSDLVQPPSAELRKLLAQIARLELQAEEARRREAARAVTWIKAAMIDYGIDAADVGL